MKVSFVNLDDTHKKDHLNVNNFKTDIDGHETTEEEYWTKLKKTEMDKWIDLVYDHYQVFELRQSEIEIILEAGKVCVVTGRVSNLYKEELERIAKRIDEEINFEDKLFMRLTSASPKDSKLFNYENSDGWSVISKLVTSDRAYVHLSKGDTKIYFVPFNEKIYQRPELEFRIFVKDGKITAISQYKLYNDYKLTAYGPTYKILEIAKRLNHPFIKFGDYVIDMWIDFKNNEGCVIELNSFGMELASGSALFHWIRDKDQLYGLNDLVEIRFTKET